MDISLKADLEKELITERSNYMRNLNSGTQIYTELLSKFIGKTFDTSIYRDIKHSRIVEVNPLAGWYKVAMCDDMIPMNCMGSAEKAYTVAYLADVTKTVVILEGVLVEMSKDTMHNFIKRFGNSEYVNISEPNALIVCMGQELYRKEVGCIC